MLTDVEQHMADMPADEVVTKVDGRTIAADTVNGSELLASPSPGQRRRLGRMYGSSSRPSTVGELLKRLRRAAGDRCGTAVDKGARQLQLTGLGVSFHACLPPAAFAMLLDDVEADIDQPELDLDVHADPEHRYDIAMMTVKEALNRWVLTTKYRIDDTVECEKERLVVKGFMQVYGADYDETYLPVSSYVTLRIFLTIVAVLDMKNVVLQSKLDRVLYMYQAEYFDDGTGRVNKLLKSLYGLKQSPLLWYRAFNGMLLKAGRKKIQVDEALYFKVGDNGLTCWVLVYVDDLLAANSSTAMLKELKELLGAVFKLRKISLVVKYVGLEIVRDRLARKLWLH
ncbi:unnamed protein product [Closterium sp. NIES-54]